MTDPLGVTTTRTYDARANLTSVSTPCSSCTPSANQTTTYFHGDSAHPGDVTSMVDPDGKTWTYTYDAFGDKISTTDPLGEKSTATYNADGWPLTAVSARGYAKGAKPKDFTTTSAYDAFGQVATVTDPLGHVTTNTYDADENLVSTKDPLGHTTGYIYDLALEQTAVHRPDGTTTRTAYTPDGKVATQVDGAGKTTSYTYTPRKQVATTTDPDGHVTSNTYDLAGNQLTTTDPIGQVTTNSYDSDNELTSVSYSDGKTPNVMGITYDADGQRTGQTDGSGAWSWTFDSLHRLTSVIEGSNGTVGYGYDLRNAVTQVAYPNGTTVTNGYDAAEREISVTDGTGNRTAFTYDPNSNLTTETLPAATKVVDTFTYDRNDQVVNIADKHAKTNLFSATYTRDADGMLTSDSSAPTSAGPTYGYTALNQLCYAGSKAKAPCASAPTTSYAYSNADNLVTTPGGGTQAFDAADQLCWTLPTTSIGSCSSAPAGATTYAYNADGDRTQATPSSGPSTTLGYDQANRLTTFNAGPTTATYTYNGDGLRMSKTVNGTPTDFAWDLSGGVPLLLQDGVTSYVYGPGGLPLEQIAGGTVQWLHHDQLGSTRLLTDTAGTVFGQYVYGPYGAVATHSGMATTLGYAGQYTDAESSFIDMRARYYDPTTGQFLSVDPSVATTRSPYGYVRGSPVNGIDPTGMAGCSNPLGCFVPPGWSGPTTICSTAAHGGPEAGVGEEYKIPLYQGDTPDSACARDFPPPSSAGPDGNGYMYSLSPNASPEWGSNGMDTGGVTIPADVNGGQNIADPCQVDGPTPLGVKLFGLGLSIAGEIGLTWLGVPAVVGGVIVVLDTGDQFVRVHTLKQREPGICCKGPLVIRPGQWRCSLRHTLFTPSFAPKGWICGGSVGVYGVRMYLGS